MAKDDNMMGEAGQQENTASGEVPENAADEMQAEQQAVADGEKTQSAQDTAPQQADAAGVHPSLPLFYKSVVALNKERHGDLKYVPPENLAFARQAHAIVITPQEVPEAALHYPIVFGPSGDGEVPYVVLGYRQGMNLFVDEEGRWKEGSYIPAYVRRYPFILIRVNEQGDHVLGADMESGLFVQGDEGESLYEDGKPSALALRALNFCMAFQNGMKDAQRLVQEIRDAGILVEKRAEVTLPGDEKGAIVGFSIVDEAAFKKLPDEAFLKLRRSGALDLIYAHLLSMRSWQRILSAARGEQA